MSDAEKKEMEALDRAFIRFFFIFLIFSFVFIYLMGTFGGVAFMEPIVKDPFLFFLSSITLSFFFTTVEWSGDQKKTRKREGKC